MQKISLFHHFILEIKQISDSQDLKAMPIFDHHHPNRVLRPVRPHPFFTTPTPIFFSQLLISMNLYEHAKNQTFSLICSRDIVDLKILQPDWSRAFWLISQEQDFSQIWDLWKNTANNINVHYRPIQKKIMIKFSNKF